MALAEATITNLTDTSQHVTCLFRPKEYTFSKSNSWTPGKAVGLTMKPPKFGGGEPMTMSLDLLFDTYEAEGDRDVRKITDVLWKMMKVSPKKKDKDTKKSEPPTVEFRWGHSWSFNAVIKSIKQTFTLFLPEGTPVRSTVHIEFLQANEQGKYPGQNPTSGGRDGYAIHTVKERETIDWIAFSEYGTADAWRHLAAANSLDDPSRLYPGQHLLLVPLND